MNKFIIAGIIAVLVIIGVGYTFGVMTGQTKIQSDIILEPQTTGRNITINLNEGLNLQASP